jgi:hypothetical protein
MMRTIKSQVGTVILSLGSRPTLRRADRICNCRSRSGASNPQELGGSARPRSGVTVASIAAVLDAALVRARHDEREVGQETGGDRDGKPRYQLFTQ